MTRFGIVLAIMLCMGVATKAQDGRWSIGPVVGLSVSTLTEADLFPSSNSYGLGWACGAEAYYKCAGRWHLSMGALYNSRVANSESLYFNGAAMVRPDATEAIVTNGEYITRGEYSTRMDLLCLPVMTHLELTKGLSFGIGLQPCVLLSAKQKASKAGYYYVDKEGAAYLSWPNERVYLEKGTSTDISGYCRTFGLDVPIGIEYRHNNIKAGLRYCFGLFNAIHGNDTQSRCLLITIGGCL